MPRVMVLGFRFRGRPGVGGLEASCLRVSGQVVDGLF